MLSQIISRLIGAGLSSGTAKTIASQADEVAKIIKSSGAAPVSPQGVAKMTEFSKNMSYHRVAVPELKQLADKADELRKVAQYDDKAGFGTPVFGAFKAQDVSVGPTQWGV